MEPYLQVEDKNSIVCLKKGTKQSVYVSTSFFTQLVLLLWITNPTPLFTEEDAGAQVDVHNFLLKAKSLI